MIRDATQSWKKWFEGATFVVAIIAVLFAGLQWYETRLALRVDQRAWVNVVVPAVFPLNGSSIPVPIQIANTGKTPAKNVEGDVVATVLKKGEQPSFDFGIGHPHNRIYAGALFPNAPINTAITVVRYAANSAEPIIPTPDLRNEIAHGEAFIMFYGKLRYLDVFGQSHWTGFCTGSGEAIHSNDLKACVSYNDVGDN